MAAPSPSHVVVFPYMAQGHTIPLLDIAKAFANRGLKVTIITTPSNAPFISSKTSNHPNISSSIIPFPRAQDLPEGCENTADLPSMALLAPFVEATKQMKQPFEGVLRDMISDGCRLICVISDFFLGWTLDSCRSFGIPRIVSHGMGVLSMAICKSVGLLAPSVKDSSDWDPIEFPNLKAPFTLLKSDIPEGLLHANPDDDFVRLSLEAGEADINSWGVVVNSFEEIEGDHAGEFESLYANQAKAYCVGPFLLYDRLGHDHVGAEEQSYSYIKWLDDQAESGGVIYVSFGTQSHFSEHQMDEIASGLEMAGHPFIWVVRSKEWVPPDGWNARVGRRGLVVQDWVDQRSILAHPATGGFLSHCGWNSVLESLSMGVPLLTWPALSFSDQPLNAKFVTVGLGVGLMSPQRGVGGEKIVTVDRDVICDGVKELMGGEEGRKARERAQALGRLARHAVEKGGSSDLKLDELIEQLTIKKCMENKEGRKEWKIEAKGVGRR
ncbi:probable UDP-glucosyl transferase 73B6 [Corylus avellana]|uniref:probable UDP-glucosyl transferase 73B6 n=1 Tax=Corylus avellana TaxID=13451 RepID=UPI00286C5703|nr:probable UDP-glucosyl transferase 73B6 [Corylus avellana]